MPTKVHRLSESPDTWNTVHDLAIAVYLDGECYSFARALHEGLGWPLIGLMEGETIRHAMVREPGGQLRDVCGATTAEELCKTFGLPLPPITREIREWELVREGEPTEHVIHSIRRARKMAEVLFPELPWHNSQVARAGDFADELEALCRRHKLWIRPMIPGAPVMLSEQIGEEQGYSLNPTSDGITFIIDRYFK